MKKLIAIGLAVVFVGIGAAVMIVMSVQSSLPPIFKIEDYKPLLVSEFYARGGEKIGEFGRENRTLVKYEQIPKVVIQAFTAAEDADFFKHGGVNYVAITRAFINNLRAGRTAQGGSTITQQTAKSLFLSSERTFLRKLREFFLAYRLEENLSKEEILYLYLNQIYFGEKAYGIGAAAETYFRKKIEKITLAEAALLAGLPQAPSRYSPADHPDRAKARQKYVLRRMMEVGHITPEEEKKALQQPILVYRGKEYKSVGPFYFDTVRQMLIESLGEQAVLDEGLRIHTSMDFKMQQDAQNQVREGLREVDKRQGYRGAVRHIDAPEEIDKFLLDTRRKLQSESAPTRIILPEGNTPPELPLARFQKKDSKGKTLTNIPEYVQKEQIVEGIVTKLDDEAGLAEVRFADGYGLIDIEDMNWARKPDHEVGFDYAEKLKKPSDALRTGDVILVRVKGDRFTPSKNLKKDSRYVFDDYAQLSLEQEPQVEGALISIDLKTQEVLAMVGGYDFNRTQFNRTIQAKRQTGSSFKSIIYASALDKGFTGATALQDAPIVYGDAVAGEGQDDVKTSSKKNDSKDEDTKVWKPHNYGNRFEGDILFRTALVRSLNIPTVKVLEKVGVSWALDYAKRLGIFSPLNPDFSMALGSSGTTLYEMTKVFAEFGRGGQRIRPIVITKVLDRNGNPLQDKTSLDSRFAKEIAALDTEYEERRAKYLAEQAESQEPTSPDAPPPNKKEDISSKIFFQDPDQLISSETAYLTTHLLSATIQDEGGTGGRARGLGRPVAGKTGTTSGYYDTWFIGYTPQISTGVWVGFDQEKSLGKGEAGGRTALPIWLNHMKYAHQNIPASDFAVPKSIVFANIDLKTGRLATAASKDVVRQAFLRGTEPTSAAPSSSADEDTEFLKQDLSE